MNERRACSFESAGTTGVEPLTVRARERAPAAETQQVACMCVGWKQKVGQCRRDGWCCCGSQVVPRSSFLGLRQKDVLRETPRCRAASNKRPSPGRDGLCVSVPLGAVHRLREKPPIHAAGRLWG